MGVFFFLLCLLEFSLNEHTLEEVNFDLMCVCGQGLDAVTCLLYFLFFFLSFIWSSLRLGAATLLPFRNTKQKHAHRQHLRAHNSVPSVSCVALSSRTITISSLLVLFVHVTQSCEGFFRNIGWDSFTKCTLYVFSKPLERPRRSHISSRFGW